MNGCQHGNWFVIFPLHRSGHCIDLWPVLAMYRSCPNIGGILGSLVDENVSLPHRNPNHFHYILLLNAILYKHQSHRCSHLHALSAKIHSFMPHFAVGLFFIYWRIPERCLDFTILSSTATCWNGWFNSLQVSLKLFRKPFFFWCFFPCTYIVSIIWLVHNFHPTIGVCRHIGRIRMSVKNNFKKSIALTIKPLMTGTSVFRPIRTQFNFERWLSLDNSQT